jgi:hypothetical protein
VEITAEEVKLSHGHEIWRRNDDILQARHVLVPAGTLHERVLARFDANHFRLSAVWMPTGRPSQLGSFSLKNERWNKKIRFDLEKCQDDKGYECYRTNKLVEMAEDIVLDCHLSFNGEVRGIKLDLLEVARSLVDPLDEEIEWPVFKQIILRWKSGKQLKKVRRYLYEQKLMMQDHQHPPVAESNEGIKEDRSKEISTGKLQCVSFLN